METSAEDQKRRNNSGNVNWRARGIRKGIQKGCVCLRNSAVRRRGWCVVSSGAAESIKLTFPSLTGHASGHSLSSSNQQVPRSTV